MQFIEDIQAVRAGDRARLSRKLIDEFELEASMILNQIGHLRSKLDARLAELELEGSNVSPSLNRMERIASKPFSASSAQEETTAFKSGIDVRREEDVFTGQKHSGWQQREKVKRGTLRRVLLSAVACTGVFYAAGVVSEFFTTGGSEGTGAVGL